MPHKNNLASLVTSSAIVPTSSSHNNWSDMTSSRNSPANQTEWQTVDCLQFLFNLTASGGGGKGSNGGGGFDCSGFDYATNRSRAATDGDEEEDGEAARVWVLLLLLIFPVFTFFGNVLVVLSVYRERSLRTVTNYFIVSLAVADIMVGVLVMPLAILQEVNSGIWKLGDDLCDTWVAFDCCCCTASILNLTAISVDRFIAVTQPIKYAKHKNSNRVYLTLAMTWVVSVAISSPIALGVNKTERRKERPFECTFFNADFLIYSSMGSFYIPTVVMILLYWRIFAAIRQRAKRASALRDRNKKPNATSIGINIGNDVHNQQQQQQHRESAVSGVDGAGRSAAATTSTLGLASGGVGGGPDAVMTGATSDTDADSRTAFIQNAGRRTHPPGVAGGAGITTTTSDTSCTDDGGATSTRELLPPSRHRPHSTIEEETSFTPPNSSATAGGGGVNMFKAKADIAEGKDNKGSKGPTPLQWQAKQSSINADNTANRSSDCHGSHTSDDDAASAPQNGGYKAPIHVMIEKGGGSAAAAARMSIRGPPASHQQQLLPLPGNDRKDSQDSQVSPSMYALSPTGPRPTRGLSAASATSGGSSGGGEGGEGKGSKTVMRFNFHLPRAHRKGGGGGGGNKNHVKTNKEKNAHKREKKATKTLAIVLGVFLLCWLPFFTINIINAICIRYSLDKDPARHPECQLDPMLFSFFVWLGYINSFLNPIIYTIFNIEFRRAFKKILQHPCSCKQ